MRAFDSSRQLADTAPIWLADTPTLADDDPMAQVLPWLVSHLGVADSLADEAGLDAAACRARPAQLLQSLQQLGFDTRLNHDPVTALRSDDLPAVLRLRTGDACVLTALQGAPGTLRRCQVVVLAPEPMSFTVSDADLARECTGPALLVRQPIPHRTTPRVAATTPVRPAAPPLEPVMAPVMAPAPAAAAMIAAPLADPLPQAMAQAMAAPMATPAPITNDSSAQSAPGLALPAADPAATAVAPPVAERPSALSQALATRRVAMAQSAEARRASGSPGAAAAAPLIHLPTLDDVIAPEELACLAQLAERPVRVAAWARSAPAGWSASEAPPPMPSVSAPRAAAAQAAAVPVTAAVAAPLPPAAPPVLPPAFPPPDAGPDVVLDLGFLDRQTGAGRLRGRVEQWQRQLSSRCAGLAALAGRRPQRRASPAAPSWTAAPPGAAGSGLAVDAGPQPRRSGWRPPFGLGWPLGQAPARAAAANGEHPSHRRDAAPPRREPTLAAVPAATMARSRAVPPAMSAPVRPADEGWNGAWSDVWADAPAGGAPPRGAPPGGMPPGGIPAGGIPAGGIPPGGLASGDTSAVGTPLQRSSGASTPLAAPPLACAPPGRSARQVRPALAALSALRTVRALPASRLVQPALAWTQRLNVRGAGWRQQARPWFRHLVDRTGFPGLAATLDRWRRSARLERWLEGPLLAACGAVCLLDGLPLAWARMVSVSGMKAAGSVLPGLMRHALAADQDRAAAVLAGRSATAAEVRIAPGAAGGRVAGPPSRSAVPAAANAPRLSAAAPAPGAHAAGGAGGGFTGPSTLAMVAARAEKAQRGRVRGVDVATTLRRRSEAMSMGPPLPARPRRGLTAGVALMAA